MAQGLPRGALSGLALALGWALLAGCGQRSYPVSGTVRLDKRPLAGATVVFLADGLPKSTGIAFTDGQGHYALQQRQDRPGLPAGKYAVRISTYRDGRPAEVPPVASVPERVPERYNVSTELQAVVGPGENVHNFELRSR